ncbi:hypothetical protein [Clostridium ganghwense]|uniref:Peptidase propeptide and YPEB domain protein n=1 Tax=Clostridium ganghwense TaxID=312089 RepID=A0ABT4CSR5_9CLOT|nr:hypothetical protein [Clostridium ganghwense]MCY6372120.1 hypothetical protein [Clostridium ganghwense]
MKSKQIISKLLLASVLMGGGYKTYAFAVQKQPVKAVQKSEVQKNDKEAQAVETIKKYFGVTFDKDKLQKNIRVEDKKELLNSYGVVSENGIYQAVWFTPRTEDGKVNSSIDEIFSVDIDEKSGEVLSAHAKRTDLEKTDTKDFIGIEEAKKVAEDFIKKNNISDIKELKFVGNSQYRDNWEVKYQEDDTFMLFYQDAKDSSKKVNLCVDRGSKKVFYFSTANIADAEYGKNDIK